MWFAPFRWQLGTEKGRSGFPDEQNWPWEGFWRVLIYVYSIRTLFSQWESNLDWAWAGTVSSTDMWRPLCNLTNKWSPYQSAGHFSLGRCWPCVCLVPGSLKTINAGPYGGEHCLLQWQYRKMSWDWKGSSHFVMETSKVPEGTMQSAGVKLSPIVLFCYRTYILTKCAHQKRGTKGNNGTVTRVQPTGFKTASLEGIHDVWGLRKTVFF